MPELVRESDAVDYYTGDDYVPQEAAETNPRYLSSATGFSGSTVIASWAAKGWFELRDYLNEGGKLLYSGKYAGFASSADGAYFYNPFEEQQGECTTPQQYPCLPLLNDFEQYWMGAYS